VALFNDISRILAWKVVMNSTTNSTISQGNPSGPTDLFLSIFNNTFVIILVLIIKDSPEVAKCIFGML
jgi:hypothetical protein